MNIKLFLVVTALTSLLCSVAAKKRVLSDHDQKEKSDLKREGNFRNPLWKRDPALQAHPYCTCRQGPHRHSGGAWYPVRCPGHLESCGREFFGYCCKAAEQ